jgi:hypothetical protein
MLRSTLAIALVMAAGCTQEVHPSIDRIVDTKVRSIVQNGNRVAAVNVQFESADGVPGRVSLITGETSQTLRITYAHQLLYKGPYDVSRLGAALSGVAQAALSHVGAAGVADRRESISPDCYNSCNNDFGVCIAACTAVADVPPAWGLCIAACMYALNSCLDKCPCNPVCWTCDGASDTCGGWCYPGTNPSCPPSISPGPDNGWGGGCPDNMYDEEDCDASDDCYGLDVPGYPGCYQ